MAVDAEVEHFAQEVESRVAQLATLRAALLQKKSHIHQQTQQQLADIQSSIASQIEAIKASTHQQLESLQPHGEDLREDAGAVYAQLNEHMEKVDGLISAQVLSDAAQGNIAMLLKKPEELADNVTELTDTASALFSKTTEWLDENMATFVGYTDEFKEESEGIADFLDDSEQELSALIANVQETAVEATEEFQAFSTDGGAALQAKAVDLLFDQIASQLADSVASVTGGIDDLNQSCVASMANVTNVLADINEQFTQVIEITEPIKPILDVAASMA